MRTPVTDRAELGYYCAHFVSHDRGADTYSVAYQGPGVRVYIRTWSDEDRRVILQALNAAYRAGANSVREVIRRELGVENPACSVVYEKK